MFRRTELPAAAPTGLSQKFSADVEHQAQWRSFLARNQLQAPELSEVVAAIRNSLAGALAWTSSG